MTHDQVRLGAAAFKADYVARPFYDNHTYAMLAAMLKEMPPSIKEPFVRDELDNLLTLEMQGKRDGTDLMPNWDDFILKIAVRLRNATGEIAKRVTPEASSLDFRGAVTGKGGGKGGKGSKGGKGADSGKGGKGKGKGAGKGAQGARPPWGCHVCGNTERRTPATAAAGRAPTASDVTARARRERPRSPSSGAFSSCPSTRRSQRCVRPKGPSTARCTRTSATCTPSTSTSRTR